jgi:uncharacterized repeat protein (TIGR03843 family)
MVTDVSSLAYESVLGHGDLTVTGRLVDASNATLLATVSLNNETLTCIYKPIAGERPLWDFPEGTLANREYAAYLISRESGLNVVPLTLLRDGPFGLGMVQIWIDIDPSLDLMEFFQSDNPQLRKMALFDAVINNTDRKIGHLLPTKDGIVFGCDHGVTFHGEDKLRTVLWQWAGREFSEEEQDLLRDLEKKLSSDFGDEIRSLITSGEFEALTLRIQRLINSKTFPLPSTEWPAVPWPPF